MLEADYNIPEAPTDLDNEAARLDAELVSVCRSIVDDTIRSQNPTVARVTDRLLSGSEIEPKTQQSTKPYWRKP